MMPSITRKLRLVVPTLLIGAVLFPHTAQANESQFSVMQDDDLLVYRDNATRDKAMRQMKLLGADVVRVTVLWSVVTEGLEGKPKTKRAKAKLKANQRRYKRWGEASPYAYPPLNWNRYDGLARACKTLGLICYFDVTGPGPSWAHKKPPPQYKKDAKWWMPSPTHFYNFVRAVGRRYNGKFKDTDEGKGTLPPVHMWSLWNEPNQGGWLRPQWLNGKAISPSLYRSLYLYGYNALLREGHGTDIIMAGETAPINVARQTTTSAMGPKIFINELLCGPGSNGIGCSEFDKKGPIKAWAWAHHPYTKKNNPQQRDADPQAITLANFDELGSQLDALSSTGHIAAGMRLMSTEFGYETNPPDPFAATTLDQQAQYIAIADYMTSTDPRVFGSSQFLLRDVPPNKRYAKGSRNYWSTYQSGLYGSTGTAKPAAKAYAFPFFAVPAGADPTTGVRTISVWGQLRFRQNGVLTPETPENVYIQWRPDAQTGWSILQAIPVVTANGYFRVDGVQLPGPGQVQAAWVGGQVPYTASTLVQDIP
jgi:hypothetical protein